MASCPAVHSGGEQRLCASPRDMGVGRRRAAGRPARLRFRLFERRSAAAVQLVIRVFNRGLGRAPVGPAAPRDLLRQPGRGARGRAAVASSRRLSIADATRSRGASGAAPMVDPLRQVAGAARKHSRRRGGEPRMDIPGSGGLSGPVARAVGPLRRHLSAGGSDDYRFQPDAGSPMNSRARAMVAPAYLFACLILGGSAQGVWQNMILQLAGVAIIAWAAFDGAAERLAASSRDLLLIAIAVIALVALQTAPLPPSLWAQLGPRAQVAAGLRTLTGAVPSEPLSLTPAATLDSLLAIIPPLAILCAMLRLRAYRPQWIAVALVGGAIAGIALGAMQVASSTAELSPWYLYGETNVGSAVGFFANVNHMASLLVVTIPFLAAIVAAGRTKNMQRYSATVAIAAGLSIVIIVGLALNRSLAGYGLALPVIAASVLIMLPPA